MNCLVPLRLVIIRKQFVLSAILGWNISVVSISKICSLNDRLHRYRYLNGLIKYKMYYNTKHEMFLWFVFKTHTNIKCMLQNKTVFRRRTYSRVCLYAAIIARFSFWRYCNMKFLSMPCSIVKMLLDQVKTIYNA